MDFKDNSEEASYRQQARGWLATHAPKYGFPLDMKAENFLQRAQAWQAEKAAAGYACISWPKEWGGQRGTPIQNVIFGAEEASAGSDLAAARTRAVRWWRSICSLFRSR